VRASDHDEIWLDAGGGDQGGTGRTHCRGDPHAIEVTERVRQRRRHDGVVLADHRYQGGSGGGHIITLATVPELRLTN